jgi:tyrosyl-tRNA synthetase
MVDNDEWLSKFGYVQFLRDYGVHFTVNRMLAFDSVKLRLEREQPMTFLEFNYMLMQATDFLELNRKYGCVLQMGGSDQWGNILNGVELTRRVDQKAAFGLTTPLLATASGAKMGKTMSGAVWLNAEQLSPYDYWQFWRNTEDADVGRFLKLFTDLPLERIAELEALPGAQINDAKKVLADEATRMAHGEDEARKARDAAEKASSKARCRSTCRPSRFRPPSWRPASCWRPVRRRRPGRLARRGPAPGAGRRLEGQRQGRGQRGPCDHLGRPRRRRRQAGGGQEEDRAGQAGLVTG